MRQWGGSNLNENPGSKLGGNQHLEGGGNHTTYVVASLPERFSHNVTQDKPSGA